MDETAAELTADEKAQIARFGIHDDPDTVMVTDFQLEHLLDDTALREVLTSYRSETGWSPWGMEVGQLEADFLSWYRWEKL